MTKENSQTPPNDAGLGYGARILNLVTTELKLVNAERKCGPNFFFQNT
jgi:hypothetical protein